MTAQQLALELDPPRAIAVHCFACKYVERHPTSTGAHDAMEAHYSTKHQALISRLSGLLT